MRARREVEGAVCHKFLRLLSTKGRIIGTAQHLGLYRGDK
jgi:hypothetical protein